MPGLSLWKVAGHDQFWEMGYSVESGDDSTESRALSPGEVVGGRYELLGLLGEGGMGAVWAAQHQVTKKRVALKVLKEGFAKDESVHRRFLREARAASAVQHPNVVQIHDVLDDPIGPIMVMDLLSGEDLCDRIHRDGQLTLEDTIEIMVPVISAVGSAHSAGIVHRDIKPENIFLVSDEAGAVSPRVLDFGIAKLHAQEGDAAQTRMLTRTGAVMGTPFYMSPEQAYGEADINHQTDVWALGVVLYECLVGKRPFGGENFGQIFKSVTTSTPKPIGEVLPHLPPEVGNLITRMLEKERSQRSFDLRDALSVLRNFGEHANFTISAPAVSLLPVSGDPRTGPGAGTLQGPHADVGVTLGGGTDDRVASGTANQLNATAPAFSPSDFDWDLKEALNRPETDEGNASKTIPSTPPPEEGSPWRTRLIAIGMGALVLAAAAFVLRPAPSQDSTGALKEETRASASAAKTPAAQDARPASTEDKPSAEGKPSAGDKPGPKDEPSKEKSASDDGDAANANEPPPPQSPAAAPTSRVEPTTQESARKSAPATAPQPPPAPSKPTQLPGGILDEEVAPF